jgi:hypothetical protein
MTYESIKCFGCRSRGDENEELRAQLAAETEARAAAEREVERFKREGVIAMAHAAREQSPGQTEDEILAATVAGNALAVEEMMITARYARRWKALARRMRRQREASREMRNLEADHHVHRSWVQFAENETRRADRLWWSAWAMLGAGIGQVQAGAAWVERAEKEIGHRIEARDLAQEAMVFGTAEYLMRQEAERRLAAASRARFADAWTAIGWLAWCDEKIIATDGRVRELTEALREISERFGCMHPDCTAPDCRPAMLDACARAALVGGKGDGNG